MIYLVLVPLGIVGALTLAGIFIFALAAGRRLEGVRVGGDRREI